ncbi:MAG TPA: sodium:solute symporter family protein [Vicinamibacterales bacterium]|nr:sodium:solute symporter family protein [Vicinamibacterales bacterium]
MQNPIALAMIAVYLVGTTLVGMWMTRRSRGGDDWAVAGGQMGILMIAVGIAGTRVGGAATYGVAGDVITDGVWSMWYGVNTFLALALVGIFYAVPYRRLQIQTVGEVFLQRFGSRRCQWLTSLCVQVEYLIVNIIEPYVIGRILSAMTGLPFSVCVLVAGLIIVTYTAMGGLWGSAATNLIHCVAILAGLGGVALIGLNHLGGWGEVVSAVNATLATTGDSAAWWSIAGAGWLPVIGMFFAATMHTPAASVYVNFAAAGRDERAVRKAFILGGLIAMPMPFLAGIIGIETLAKYGASAQLSSYQTLTRLAIDINPFVGGVAVAAVLAAVVSSGGPILLSSATMFVRDWIPGSKDWTQERRLRAYRTTTIIYGGLSAVIAWLGPITSILDLLLFGFAMVVPPALAVTFVLYWKRTTELAAFLGIALGLVGGLIWYAITHFFVIEGADGIDPSYATMIIPLIVIPVVSLLTQADDARKAPFFARLAGTERASPQV